MHEIDYGFKYPAIRAITDLQQMRDQGSVSIAFDRVGYTLDDVLESSLYVYIGKCGEHTGWISDDAPYGDALTNASSKKYILKDAFLWTSSQHFYPESERVYVPPETQGLLGITAVETETKKYCGSDIQGETNGGGSLLPSNSPHNGNKYYGKWRKITGLDNRTVKAYYADSRAGGYFQYDLKSIDAYTLKRDKDGTQVFDNPTDFAVSAATDEQKSKVLKRFSQSIDFDHYYDYRFSKFGEKASDIDKNRTFVVEVGLDELFYLSGGMYKNQYQTSATVNLDFNPHTMQPEISSKDKGKLMYNIFHGKTPIFFMIAERIKTSHYGLTNFYFAPDTNGKKLNIVSSKKQAIEDMLYNAGDILTTIDVCSGSDEIQRIFVDLAQGNGYNPSYENNKRRVWVTTKAGKIMAYDYWTGARKTNVDASTSKINAGAINPKTGEFVFVKVVGNTKSSFLQVCKIARDSSNITVIANIPDYAAYTMPRYPMTGGYESGTIAERITGGVISKNPSGGHLWFTFVVNMENTISVDLSATTPDIRWVDRMHYGLWHGSNAYGIAKNKNNTEYQQVKHGAYYAHKEYGVGANIDNVRGITTGIGGNVYVNGHNYLHYDDKKYKKYNTIGVHFKDQIWHYDGTEMNSCGHWFSHNYDGTDDRNKYWSYDFDEDAGCWKQDANGYAVLVKKALNEPGWPAGKLIFRVKNSNSGMTANIVSQIVSRLGKDGDGDHWCRMSWYASEFQTNEATRIQNMFDSVGNFPPLKPGQKTGLVSPDGSSFVAEAGTPNFGGSGYGCHMGSTEKKVSIQGGDKDYRPLNIGFLYNAESYSSNLTADADATTKRPVFSTDGDRGRFFTAQTVISEDDPAQKGNGAMPSATPSGWSYNFNVASGTINPVPQGDFLLQALVRDGREESKTFCNRFNYLTIDQPKYISKSIVPNNNVRVGFCEDAHGIPAGQGNLHRWKGTKGDDDNGITTFSAGSNENLKFVNLPYNITNTLWGLEESLPKNGRLNQTINGDGRWIYQTYVGAVTAVNGTTGNGFRVVKYGDVREVSITSDISTMGLPSNFGDIGTLRTVYTDGTNGLWYEKNGKLCLETTATSDSKYKIAPKYFKGNQITNFGHNRCSNPYFECVAYAKGVTGVKYGYEQYAGAKDFAVAEAVAKRSYGGLVSASLTVNDIGQGDRYNDDPVGMRALKALGYCWTKSTKVHPTDVMPSGRLYVIDHYVIEDNPCKFMDKIYLDADRTQYDEIAVSSMSAASSEFITWNLKAKEKIELTEAVKPVTFEAGGIITSGKYIECSATSAIMVDTWGDTISNLSDKMELTSSFEMSAATIQRPRNGLPRVSNSFWDYSTDEGVIVSGQSDEAAAVDAFEYLNMIKLPSMYLSDGSTIIGNPVSFRAAGYDKLYTAHLASIYDSGSYEIDHVSIWFKQNDDSDYTKDKSMYRSRTYGPTQLSSITIRDKEGTPTFGRETIVARSNKQLSGVLDDSKVVYNHYRDTYCLSADNVWDSINAYGKPQGSTDLSARFQNQPELFSVCSTADIGGHPLRYLYGQTCPRQWYGTEIYKYVNYVGSEDRISMMHTMSGQEFVGHHMDTAPEYLLPSYISGYGVHPSVYPEESSDINFVVEASGAMVENARFNGQPHLVGGSFTTNTYAYVDEREQPSAVTVDMGTNNVYVYERWPTQHWYPTCTDGRGGLELFGDCPDFEDD